MDFISKKFEQLSLDEVHEIYKLRLSVFVVEQNCSYQDVDDADKASYHLFLRDEDGIQAYLRLSPKGALYEEACVGRVISKKRRQGLASTLLQKAIALAKETLNAPVLLVIAQAHARPLYEKAGFTPTGEEFLQDGIPRIRMTKQL